MSKNKQESSPYIIVGIIIVLVIVGFIIAGAKSDDSSGPSGSSTYSASSISTVNGTFDFGTISMKDGNVTHAFELKNEGAEAVKIEKVYTSCMCTTASIIDASGKEHGAFGMQGHGSPSKADIEVGAGESVTLEAVFDPAAHGPSGVGMVERSIYVETNSAKSPKLELTFRATVAQ